MSIFSNVIRDLESFAAKVEAAFKKLFGEAPSWIAIAQGVLTYLGPIVVTILTLGGGSVLGVETNVIIANIKTDLATALAIASTADAATSLPTLLAGIQSQLPALLAAIKVSNPASLSKIENDVSIVDAELTALLSAASAMA
jgi:hypothetical protein